LVKTWQERAQSALRLCEAQSQEIEAWENLCNRLDELVPKDVEAAPLVVLASQRVEQAQQATQQVLAEFDDEVPPDIEES
tara:strand:- start:9072 stop:9311 length:240 start_codon:yes stop_codon:yes gene_type:complete